MLWAGLQRLCLIAVWLRLEVAAICPAHQIPRFPFHVVCELHFCFSLSSPKLTLDLKLAGNYGKNYLKKIVFIDSLNDKKYICCEYFKLIVRKVSIFLVMRIIFSLLHSCFFYCQGTQVLLYDKMILCGTKDTISFGIDIQSRICGVMYRNNW